MSDHQPESSYTCPTTCVEQNHPRSEHDAWANAEVVRAVGNLLGAHQHNEWTGRCSCGDGPFSQPEWAGHVNALKVTSPSAVEGGGDRG